MKFIKYSSLLLAVALAFGFTSCNSDDDESGLPVVFPNIGSTQDFNTQNYWSKCYDVATGAFIVDGVSFSHSAQSYEYDGVSYGVWNGFCPSRVNDTQRYPDSWTDHQWACVSPNPNGGTYLVCNSDANVRENAVDNTTCSISLTSGRSFIPRYMLINNSSYTVGCAVDGSDFNPKFTGSDTFDLVIVGVRNGAVTKKAAIQLIKGQNYLQNWTPVYLDALGVVDTVLLYADSSCKDPVYGLKVPSYFCIADFGYTPATDVTNGAK